ncbi:protein kinase, partial [Helicosporidium sp. ATCC 50920]
AGSFKAVRREDSTSLGTASAFTSVHPPFPSPSLESDFTVGEVLGRGAYGTVRLATEKSSGKQYACKSILKSKLVSRSDVEDVRKEVEILNLLTPHGTIAGILRAYEDSAAVHIVMDYCAGGELFERIVSRGVFSERDAARVFAQMVDMVRHCHSLGIMHRDIKPENFLLTDATDAADLRACDFGLSVYFKRGQVFESLVGSAYYVAPEVLQRRYGPECDLWSLGVVLYVLLSGLPPFWGRSEQDIFQSILRGALDFETPPWPSVSPEAKAMVSSLLHRDPAKRPSPSQILAAPWLQRHGGASDRPLDSIVIARMKNFAAMTKLKKVAVFTAAHFLSYDQIQGLRELFKSFDQNGDGVVTLAELWQGLREHQPDIDLQAVERIMQDMDVDGSGGIDYEEFLAATVNLTQLEREETFIKAFRHLDKDGSGLLNVEEVRAAVSMLGSISEEEAQALIAQHDQNGDGLIDYAEFVAMLRDRDTSSTSSHFNRTLAQLSQQSVALRRQATELHT